MRVLGRPLVVLAAGGLLLAACGWGQEASSKPAGPPPAVPVSLAAATVQTVPVQIEAVGNVEAYSTVRVKSQVEGQIKSVHFSEGQEVAKGSLLFTIDPRPFQAALEKAKAQMARNEALHRQAAADALRYQKLVERDLISRQQYEQARTEAAALEAAVSADRAAVEWARLQLSYCYIHAPVSGRAGELLLHPGNVVKADADEPMVVIHQTRPIYVNFAVPEPHLGKIQSRLAAGGLKVRALIPESGQPAFEGTVSFVDNAVDATTGTIRLKAVFPNTDGGLWPGQFVRSVLTLRERRGAVVVPAQAVQRGQQGQFVFVADARGCAQMRPVEVAFEHEGMAVIERGVAAGERVVTDGQVRLRPGMRLQPKVGP